MRFMRFSAVLLSAALLSFAAEAATGQIRKVLPQFVDRESKVALSPSLFARDAYQAELKSKPKLRSGLKFAVSWKTKGPQWQPLKIRLEMRGIAEGALPREKTLEKAVRATGWFGAWTGILVTGEQYDWLGEVTAWRVTLWEGERLLDEQTSFLW